MFVLSKDKTLRQVGLRAHLERKSAVSFHPRGRWRTCTFDSSVERRAASELSDRFTLFISTACAYKRVCFADMSGSKLMRAIRVSEFGAPSVLKLCSDVTVPQPGHRQVRHTGQTLSGVSGRDRSSLQSPLVRARALHTCVPPLRWPCSAAAETRVFYIPCVSSRNKRVYSLTSRKT